MKQIAKVVLSVFLVYLMFNCAEKEKEVVPITTKIKLETKIKNVIPDSIVNRSVFIHETPEGFTRIWVDSKKNVGKYFYSDTLNSVKVGSYNFENQVAKISKKIEIYSTDWSYLRIDSASIKEEVIDQEEYLFLTLLPEFMGKAITERSVVFYLINLNNIGDHASLTYSGYSDAYCNECIKGEFEPVKNYPANKDAWRKFQQYANRSKFISQLKNAERKITYFKNYEQKWESDNKTDNHFGAGFGGAPDPIYSTYYKENLFEANGHSVDKSIENDRYIIGTYFRGNLVGFDKKNNLYFPIIVESCTGFCNKEISFLNDQTIQIVYEYGEKFAIKLDEILF